MTVLSPAAGDLLRAARRAVMGTVTADGRARLVPICFWLDDRPDASEPPLIYSPLDEKRKRSADPRLLGRVRDLQARPAVTLLVDRWDEDWRRLAWLRLDGTAALLEPPRPGDDGREHERAVAGLRDRYPPYRHHHLAARPLIRIAVDRVTEWHAA
ncbi:MAG: TIGR03668 family PPOX class F420-dependent oxidoreductase [Candidatus Limnocylindrales bacterium]